MLLVFLQKRICFSCAGIAVMMNETICFVIFFLFFRGWCSFYIERNGDVCSLNGAEFNFFSMMIIHLELEIWKIFPSILAWFKTTVAITV